MTVKICHVTTVHDRYDTRIYNKECISLAKKYDVFLLVADLMSDEKVNNVNIVPMAPIKGNRLNRICGYKSVFKSALHIDADIYHLHDPELLLIARPLLKKNKKVIFDSHEYYYEQIKTKSYIPLIFRNLVSFLYKKYETHICKKINAVISVCPLRNGERIYDPFKNRCKRHVYIANYPAYNEMEQNCKIKQKFKVCYAGGLTYERGIEHLIDACYIAGCDLILAGEFSSDQYHSKLKEKKSYKCVDYRGKCTNKEVFDIYREASLGAATLLDFGQYFKIETFPVKVYEYFQMKLPVLISNYKYAHIMNEKYKFGVCVDPTNVSEMAEEIRKMMNNEAKAKSLGENGYKLYKEKLNWGEMEKKLFDLYDNILEER